MKLRPNLMLLGRLPLFVAAGVCFSLFTSCQTSDREPYGVPDAESQQWREQASQSHSSAMPVPSDPLPFTGLDTPDRALAEAVAEPELPSVPVEDLNIGREVDVAVFLRALARGAEINLMVGEHVSGPIRLTLPKQTTWDRLFKMVVDAHGLHYEWQGDLLRVMAQRDIERQISMEKALREREEARELRKRSEPLELELYRVRYADVNRLAESIKAGMGGPTSEGAANFTIIPDADSGTLILHAPPSRMNRVRALAQTLDRPAQQILIEATIVQTNSETARDLGFQWGASALGRDGGTLDVGTSSNADGWNSFFPADIDPEMAGFSFGAVRTTANGVLQAQLSALQKDGRLRIISTPSITTLDKQTALIESGEERPFQSASGSGATTTSTVEFKKAVLSLEVTPQVIDGQWIKLNIKTTKDDFDDSRPIIIDGTLQLPIITRAANTMLYLADGQTTVIGGLSSQTENDGRSGVPWLQDIPLFGALFRTDSTRTAFSDTLIFITPRILPAAERPLPAREDLP